MLGAAAAVVVVAGAAAASPPSPSPGLDYRVVLSAGEGRPDVEIRRSGTQYRHEILEPGAPPAVIFYDSATGDAVVIDGQAVFGLALSPSEIGGFDAPAMMAGMVDGAVEWREAGERRIAGAPCTDHVGSGVAGGVPLTGRFCVTADGVVLAIDLGGPGQIGRSLVARIFEPGPQPPALFAWPAPPPDG